MNYISHLNKILRVSNEKISLSKTDRQKYSDEKLPLSYLEFIENFGAGNIDDFLWILSPFTDNLNLNIFTRTEEVINTFTDEFEYVSEFVSDIKNNHSFLVATTDNSDYIFHISLENSEKIVVLDGRLGSGEAYEMDFTEFLYKLLSQDIQSKILEPEFFKEKIFTTFELE